MCTSVSGKKRKISIIYKVLFVNFMMKNVLKWYITYAALMQIQFSHSRLIPQSPSALQPSPAIPFLHLFTSLSHLKLPGQLLLRRQDVPSGPKTHTYFSPLRTKL